MKIKKLPFFLFVITALILLIAATGLCASAEKVAYPVEGGNIYFNPATGAIVGCDPTITRADIPEYIDGVMVTRIDKYAFTQEHHIGAIEFIIIGTPSLKYVSIPDTVRVFGASAFYGSSIDSLVLPDRNDLVFMIDPATTLGPFDFGTETVYYRGSKSTFGTMTYEFSGPGYGYFTTFVCDYKCEGIYGHEYNDWTAVKLPTCTEKGEDIRTCSLCGESETRTVSARHTWSDVIVVIKPSCTTTGSGVRSCLNCDISQTVVIPVEHSFGKWVVIQDYACIEGIKRRTCTICKAKEEEMLPATEDHSWSDWKEEKTATCTVEGEESRYCLDCSYIESRTTPTNDNHSWSDWVTTIAPTTETEGKEVRLCTVCGETESRIVTLTCNHSFGEWTITVVPCHGDGEKVRTCSVCGESETRVIPTTGNHTYGEWILYREPDCEINGLYVSTCIYCEFKQYRTIDPIGHDYGAWTLIVPPTCFEDGLEIRICSVCGAEKQRAVSSDTVHKWSEWKIVLNPTCVDSGISTRSCKLCSKAEEKSVDPTQEHVYGNWNVIRDPTCTKSGLDERFCLECNAGKQTRYTFPTGKHIYDDSIVIPPACEADVSVTKTCTQCGMRETFVYPATGHNPVTEIVVSPTCTIEGVFKIYCRNCNTVLFTDVIAKASHSFGEWIVTVPASCTVDGEEFRECENCGASEVQAIPATGEHSFGEWKVTTPASCDLPGEATRECENCDASESREIEPIAHTEVHVELKDPTCVEDGNIEYYYCSVCGYHRTPDGLPTNRFNVILPATGEHSFGEWIVTIPASCTVDGEESRKCENCDAFEAQAIPATGIHTFGEWSVTAESTVFDAGEQSRSCSVCGETETEELAKLEMTNPFTDVSDGKWYTDGILYCYYKGYMAGVSEDIFGYKESVTRAMFVTVLAKIDGADLSAYNDSSFSDVKPGQWYSAAIEWAASNGYAAGIGDGVFGYKQNVSREQLAMFLYTYSQKNGVDVSRREDISKFTDADRIHAYALDAVKWAVHCDLISGTSDTTLSPRDSATRAEIALIVMNYVEKVKAPAA